MRPGDLELLLIVLYKALVLLVGLAFAWMGYRLFVRGIVERSGDMEVKGGTWFGIKIRRAAPGVFFAVLGASIVIFAVTRILQFSQTQTGAVTTPGSSSSTTPTAPAKPPQKAGAEAGATTTTICDTCEAPSPVQPPANKNSSVTTKICDTCASPAPRRALIRSRPVSPPH